MALDGGLMVPVIRDADRKSLTQVAREARDLAGRARTGRLAADEVGGGTFTVSNLGMFGVQQFTRRDQPPGGGHPGRRGGRARAGGHRDGGVEVRQVLRLTLSIDHRALDGATGARFLAQLKEVLEQPLRIVA